MASREDGTRQRILTAAGEIFSEQGFEHATIRDIITRAEVNLAAVNYHFGDKERLYRATIRHAHEIAIEQAPLPEWDADTPPDVKLRDIVGVMLQRMLVIHRLPWQTRLMMREFSQPTGACPELVEDFIRPHHEQLLAVLRSLAPAGTPDWKLQQYAFSVVGQCMFYKLGQPIVGMLVPTDQVDQHFALPQLAEHITGVMLAAFGRQRESSLPAMPGAAGKRNQVKT